MSLSYREKTIWGSLVATLLVYGRYFTAGPASSLVATIIALAIIEIGFQTVLAIANKPEPRDERDHLIEVKAYKIGYLLLVTGCIECFMIGLTTRRLLFALVASQVGKHITQIFYYRRGA